MFEVLFILPLIVFPLLFLIITLIKNSKKKQIKLFKFEVPITVLTILITVFAISNLLINMFFVQAFVMLLIVLFLTFSYLIARLIYVKKRDKKLGLNDAQD